MMVDDGKRRETARRLRAAAEQADPAAGVSETEIFCILDVDLGGERGFADRQDVLRLADLIDRPATQGSGNRRAATCEDIDFLIALQEEMNTQPHVGQADPRFWVVQVSSYRDATDADDIDRVRFIDDEWIETDRMTLDEAMEAAYRAEVEVAGEEHARDIVAEFGLWMHEDGQFSGNLPGNCRSFVEHYSKVCGKVAFFETCERKIAPNTMFLTLREAQDHIESNRHNYEDPRPFAMTAWRSPQVEQLYRILHEVDFAFARRAIIRLLEEESETEESPREIAAELRHAANYGDSETLAGWWNRLQSAVLRDDDFPDPRETFRRLAELID